MSSCTFLELYFIIYGKACAIASFYTFWPFFKIVKVLVGSGKLSSTVYFLISSSLLVADLN